MPDARHELGRRGEALAAQFLRRQGWKPIARNFCTPAGEIDLIFRAAGTIVFVEVKTLSDRRFKNPEDAVTRSKLTRMTRAAQWFLAQRGWSERAYRFDVVSVVVPAAGPPEIERFENVYAD